MSYSIRAVVLMLRRLAVPVQKIRQHIREDSQLIASTHLAARPIHPQRSYSLRDDPLAVFSSRLVVRVNPDGRIVMAPVDDLLIGYTGPPLKVAHTRRRGDFVADKPQGLSDVWAQGIVDPE
jgi:hypothetical protein